MRRSEATPISADRPPRPDPGFTLLELVAAISLFALIIVYVLADREDSLILSADAKIIQTVQYLAAAKIDEIRRDPEAYGENEGGDFEDLENDWQKFPDFTWEIEVERVVVVGKSNERDDSYLYAEDEEAEAPSIGDDKTLSTRYVRRLTLTVKYEPEGEPRPDLSVVVKTYLPASREDDPKPEAGQ